MLVTVLYGYMENRKTTMGQMCHLLFFPPGGEVGANASLQAQIASWTAAVPCFKASDQLCGQVRDAT